METPDRHRAFFEAWGKLLNGDTADREELQALFKMLASMGITPTREQPGNAYANGPVRDGQLIQPDCGAVVSCYLIVGIESLGYDALNILACIMSDPTKRPQKYEKSRALEVNNACTEVAKGKRVTKHGWPELKNESNPDVCRCNLSPSQLIASSYALNGQPITSP